MPEKPITQKITKLIKDADKLVQDIQKGVGRIIIEVKELKDLGKKSEGEKKD